MQVGGDMGAEGPDGAVEEVGIREMTLDDYDAVTRLWAEAGLPYRPLGRDRPDKIRVEMERGTAVFLVAEADDQLVGVVLGTHDGRRGWINRLAVAPAYRRHGIAGRLVREVQRRVEAMGIDIVAALIESDNDASLEFFRAMDYVHGRDVEYVSKRRSADT
jgi:ribosomal protein S18 acetylase RimI-like enzyme